jgi:hypothetical protein
MEDLRTEDLVIHVDGREPEYLRLDWLGSSNSGELGDVVIPFFKRVLDDASQDGRVVDMHFEALEYFNSSMVSVIIHFIHEAAKAKVALHIHYDAALRWQALSFDALERAVHSLGKGEGANVEFSSAPS